MTPLRHDELGARAAHWVRQHYPQHAAKALQGLLNVEERTAKRILAGDSSSRLLVQMSSLFGDSFRGFVFGAALPAMSFSRFVWITAAAVHDAPAGLDIFARDWLQRSPADGVDFAGIARRNLGWVGVRLSGATAELSYEAGADPLALSRARDWLSARADQITRVSLSGVEIDTLDAIVALERLSALEAVQDRASNRGWHVERCGLDSITAPILKQLVHARAALGNHPGSLPGLLSRTGALPFSAIYHRDRRGVYRTLHVGERLGIKSVDVLGKPLSERRDSLYRDLLASRLETARIEPTYHRLRLQTAGHWWDYGSYATADAPDDHGEQILGICVDIKSKVAA